MCMYADSNLGALQLDSPRQLASEQRAHPAIEGEASDSGNPNGDDEEDSLSIMSMTDDEEEEACLPVRWEQTVKTCMLQGPHC